MPLSHSVILQYTSSPIFGTRGLFDCAGFVLNGLGSAAIQSIGWSPLRLGHEKAANAKTTMIRVLEDNI